MPVTLSTGPKSISTSLRLHRQSHLEPKGRQMDRALPALVAMYGLAVQATGAVSREAATSLPPLIRSRRVLLLK